jgi:hypothetical protein
MEIVHQQVAELPYNGQAVLDTVDNPNYRVGYHNGEDKTLSVMRSIRDDPLAGLWARKQIDKVQFDAGREWQRHYETAGIGQVVAVDPLREPVDGGGAGRADWSDRQSYAFYKLKESRTFLGLSGYALVSDVLGLGLPIIEVARRRGNEGQHWVKYYGMRFRECLESLALGWGHAGGIPRGSNYAKTAPTLRD